ncbi:hypothetical protein QMO56_09615 [Roseomonas sp. E05]|uniref:antibiotic biosynthesis monooxygenase family protein n=1 Tax=Roseomonas sp. E05 TaxID=3046310 RepID=UPI0024BBE2E2|nr:antibiotic biosynthesis monooxygenase [Roseomonas sp. E05]MDJ0388370.1 hypothetical protein [Roseomonas sp. E05]
MPAFLRSRPGNVAVLAGISELWPAEGRRQDTPDRTAALREELEGTGGFPGIERFASLSEPGKLLSLSLSLSLWRDEAAIAAWRRPAHRASQALRALRRPGCAPAPCCGTMAGGARRRTG